MKKSKPLGWTTTRRYLPSLKQTIRIHRRADEQQWDDIAASYWVGTLPGLEKVSSSQNTEVQYGVVSSINQTCYFKRFFVRKRIDYFKQLVLSSRARKALLRGLLLEEYGFRAPESFCVIERQHFGVVTEGALVAKAMVGCRPIVELLRSPELKTAGNLSYKRSLLRQLGREVGKLHRYGLFHGDMNLGNILCNSGDTFSFYWIDNERTKKYMRLPLKRRIQNLKQMNRIRGDVSRTDRLRVWKEYQSINGLNSTTTREVLRQVLAQTKRDWDRGWELV